MDILIFVLVCILCVLSCVVFTRMITGGSRGCIFGISGFVFIACAIYILVMAQQVFPPK
jgi:hypothetical protein